MIAKRLNTTFDVVRKMDLSTIIEISWITDHHFNDPNYDVGLYITPNSFGDWTDHPNYSGVNHENRPDDCPIEQWIKSFLPTKNLHCKVILKESETYDVSR